MLGASYGFSKAQARKWIKILRPALPGSLQGLQLLSQRKGNQFTQVLTPLKSGSIPINF